MVKKKLITEVCELFLFLFLCFLRGISAVVALSTSVLRLRTFIHLVASARRHIYVTAAAAASWTLTPT